MPHATAVRLAARVLDPSVADDEPILFLRAGDDFFVETLRDLAGRHAHAGNAEMVRALRDTIAAAEAWRARRKEPEVVELAVGESARVARAAGDEPPKFTCVETGRFPSVTRAYEIASTADYISKPGRHGVPPSDPREAVEPTSDRDLAKRERLQQNRRVVADLKAAGTLNTFQAVAASTAVYPAAGDCPLYPAIGLVDEACETLAAWLGEGIAWPPDRGLPSVAVTIDLIEFLADAGKLAGRFKKLWRDGGGVVTHAFREAVDGLRSHLVGDLEALVRTLRQADAILLPPLHRTGDAEQRILKEQGDALYYAAQSATELGRNLKHVAVTVADKLQSRLERDALHGSGDDR